GARRRPRGGARGPRGGAPRPPPQRGPAPPRRSTLAELQSPPILAIDCAIRCRGRQISLNAISGLLGDSSTVEQRTLTPLILVRIQVPQPLSARCDDGRPRLAAATFRPIRP